jgi:hypothetical protein
VNLATTGLFSIFVVAVPFILDDQTMGRGGMQPLGMQPLGMQPLGMQPLGMQPLGMQPLRVLLSLRDKGA